MDKKQLRLEMLKVSEEKKKVTLSSEDLQQLLSMLGNRVLSYIPVFSTEPQIDVLNQYLLERRSLYLPKIEGENLIVSKVVELFPYHQDVYKTLIPHKTIPSSLYEIDTVIVPCVAVDLKFNRLGRGKGYYDKLLALLPNEVKTVVIAAKWQLLEKIPVDPWDRTIDKIFVINT